ncbi:MAG: AraC family transcriptional regulator [Planctomycetota bacterium]|nr:MAG: AraC family transcriptional regulator [Planctomycetota bacterium]
MTESSVPAGPPPEVWLASDPLGEALHFLRMSGVVYTRSELTAPWSIDLPAMPDCVLFHVVTSGQCWLATGGAEPIRLQPGEFTLVPHGEGHQIADALETPPVNLFDLPREQVGPRYEILRHGGGGERTQLVCGAVRFDHPAARELVRLLPRIMRIQAWNSPQAEWMQSTLRLMASESGERQPGGETVVTRLADVLVIQAIRSWISENPAAQSGWLGALHDDRIGPAILWIQKEPSRQWTVASLAREVAMSRSAFAARFRNLVGESPMQYLTRWRMHLATSDLREGEATVAELARKLGYRSEAAFSRAYKRIVGVPPGSVKLRSK